MENTLHGEKIPENKETNTEIKGNQNKLDKWDYAISISSGAITAAMDILWVKDINLFDARTWGKEKVEDFVMAVAKNQKGYSGKNLKDAIKFLEDKYPIAADDFTNDFGGETASSERFCSSSYHRWLGVFDYDSVH